jgi:hypothetical protein
LSASENPLLSDRERKAVERKREIDRRRDSIQSRLSPAGQLTVTPSVSWGGHEKLPGVSEQVTDSYEVTGVKRGQLKAKAIHGNKTTRRLHEMAIELPSPGSNSVAPTEPSTPSPKPCTSQSTQGASTKAPRFSLPLHSLC